MNLSIISFFLILSLLVVLHDSFIVAAAGVPYVSSQFSVVNMQIDDTLDGELMVQQVIIEDPINKRSKMVAQGALVNGFLEQIVRCDGPLSPEGYLTQLTGPNVNDTMCVNQTVNEEWSNFWSWPSNATYLGKEAPPKFKEKYDAYMYWDNSEQYKVYLAQRNDSATGESYNVPIWSGKVFTSVSGFHLYHMQWVNFIPGPPPVASFSPTGSTANCQQLNKKKITADDDEKKNYGIKLLKK